MCHTSAPPLLRPSRRFAPCSCWRVLWQSRQLPCAEPRLVECCDDFSWKNSTSPWSELPHALIWMRRPRLFPRHPVWAVRRRARWSAVTIRRAMRLEGCPAWRQRPARKTPLPGRGRRASRRPGPMSARPSRRQPVLGGGLKQALLAAKSGRVHGPIAARRVIRSLWPSPWIGPGSAPQLPRRSKARR